MITLRQNLLMLSTLLVLFMLLAVNFAFGQADGSVSGKVIDESGAPLAGALIVTSVGNQGVTSLSDGTFKVAASVDEKLTISFFGYITQIIDVDSRSHIDVRLEPPTNIMDELVVVGYGVQKRANLTGAVSSVNYAKEAASRPVTSTAQVLMGMNAGVMVTQTSGQPGQEGMLMTIRGVGTLNSSSPLVIVDGFEATISNVNPDDIETVSILKDAASCAIYGNRGANGVVLITTKSGETGKTNASYSATFAFNKYANKFNIISNYADYMDVMNESAENIESNLPFSQAMIDLWRDKEKHPNAIADSGYPNYVAYPNVDWLDALFETNLYQKHNISVNSSNKNTKFLLSMTYLDNPGIITKTGVNKFQLRANVSSQINKWLEIGTRIWGYESARELNDLSGASSYMSRSVPGIYPFYDGKYGWMENPEQSSNSRNSLYFMDRIDGKEKTHYLNAALFANVKLPLNIKYNVSFNYARNDTKYKKWSKTLDAYSFSRDEWAYFYQDLSKLGLDVNHSNNYRWTFQNNLSWGQVFDNKHDISALVGFEAMYNNASSTLTRKTNFMNDKLVELNTVTEMANISGTQTDYSTASIFGRINYAYDNRYLLEMNLRYDGSSRFARESRWGLFPSVSVGWRISEEQFMKGTGINNLKLRASWGKLGNHSIGNYEYQATYDTGYLYSFGGKQYPGTVATLSNPLLEWETTTSSNFGLEFATFNSRLTLETDIYSRVTDGILYRAPVFATVGNKSAPLQNLCEVTNNGFELTLGWRDRIKGVRYGISANFTRNYNQVSKYKGALQAGWVTDANGNRTYQTNIGDVTTQVGNMRRVMEGKLINEFYLLDTYGGDGSHFYGDGSVNPKGGPRDGMIRSEQDMAWAEAMVASGNTFLPNKNIGKKGIWYGDYLYADTNGDGVFGDENDYRFQDVSMTPKFYYGFQFDIAWKGIDFSMLWTGAGGFSMYWRYLGFNAYSTRLDTTIAKDIAYDHYFYDPQDPSDPRTNLTSKHGRLTMNYGSEQNGGTNYSTNWLYKGDYIKLKNITIGYTLPNKWLKTARLQDARIFISGENLFTFTKYPGMDPELNDTMNYYASLKQYTLGFNIKF